ncbi:hypothetical protein DFJ58DRAFT_718646 [Suillus subalutaceus]|uniref:uncharacterized protein n=1 Tax=Suillus subalutaceus TaxID=48586 RepID=UPI001B87F226|nr:uncharacterized protein DFJ58DRAFT_718646 [Suillus subalutaceus]KAG1838897.1 hypothetical protein DFJ58DRAFT_718646 [Suillus subalutaceus]
MGNRKISADLKFAAIRLHEQGILRLSKILDCVGFSRMTFYRIKKLHNDTGNIVKPRSQYTGRPCIFNLEDLHYLLELIHHQLARAGISLKKLRKIAKECNEDVHADFKRRVAQYTPDQLLFIDETSKDEHTQIRRYGRAKRSRYASMKGSLRRNGYLHFLKHSVVSRDSSHLTFFVNSCLCYMVSMYSVMLTQSRCTNHIFTSLLP